MSLGRLSIHTHFPMREWSAMDRFIGETHGEGHVLRHRPLFEWFFVRDEPGDRANVLVAYESDRLVSLLGYLPTRFLWGGDVVDGAWMAHWMTAPAHRHGIGALLMRRITELFPIVAGQGASAMNRAIVTKMKFAFLDRMPKVVYVFKPAVVRELFGYVAEPRPALDGFQSGDPREVREIDEMNFSPDWKLYPTLSHGTLRDAAYLRQRYLEYPFFVYHVFIEGERREPVVCVARLVETTAGIKVARILELFFPETGRGREQAHSLIAKCLRWFQGQGCDYADFYSTGAAAIDLLSAAGFTPDDEGVLPSLLDPVDRSRTAQNLELYVRPDLASRSAGALTPFYATRADGDQDRPNASYRSLRN